MKTQSPSPMHQLDDDQLATLISIVIEESGDKLTRRQFDDAVLMLFENIAGFESLPRRQADRYLKSLWTMYRSSRDRV